MLRRLLLVTSFIASVAMAEEASEHRYPALADPRVQECQDMLKRMDYLSREKQGAEVTERAAAAEVLLMLTLEHPVVHRSARDSNVTDQDLFGLYHLSAGFQIRPPSNVNFLGTDRTRYSKHIKSLSLLGLPAIANTQNYFNHIQTLYENVRTPATYLQMNREIMRKQALRLIRNSLSIWRLYADEADRPPSREHHRIHPPWYHKGNLFFEEAATNDNIKFRVKDLRVFSSRELSTWRQIWDLLNPRQASGRGAMFLIMNDIPDSYPAKRATADRIELMILDFVAGFFPTILQARDEVMERALRPGGSLRTELRNSSPARDLLREQIRRLTQGLPVEYPDYEKESGLLTAPEMQLALPSPMDEAQPLKTRMQDLVAKLESSSQDELKLAQEAMIVLDELVDRLPARSVASTILGGVETPEGLAANLPRLQKACNEVQETAEKDLATMDALLEEAHRLVKLTQARLAHYGADIEQREPRASARALRLEQSELLQLSLAETLATLSGRHELQIRWVSSLSHVQALSRRLRAQAAAGEDIVPLASELLGVLSKFTSGRDAI